MLHASDLLAAGTVGFEEHLKMSSVFASYALLRVLARQESLHISRPLPYDAALLLRRISDVC